MENTNITATIGSIMQEQIIRTCDNKRAGRGTEEKRTEIN